MKKCRYAILIAFAGYILQPQHVLAQTRPDTTIGPLVTLQQCISFALRNQPAVKQAGIDEEINEKNISIALADWLPQVNATGNAQHYFEVPTTYIPNFANPGSPGSFAANGLPNTSTLSLQGTQTIYNPTVALAARTSKFSRQYFKQNTQTSQINVVAEVSKAFYDVLLSQKQLSITDAEIVRLKQSVKDAFDRYNAGIVDKIDYKQATIALNNSLAQRKQSQEAIKSKLAFLKQMMGYATEKPVQLSYDSVRLEQETLIDTTQALDITKRVEYNLLQTQRTLQGLNADYYRTSYLPSLSAFGTYNLAFFNSKLPDLYSHSYANSLVGLTVSIPVFTGTKRLQNLSKARLQVDRADLDIVNTRNLINTQYVQALAVYKSSYNDYTTLKQNVALARDVYNVVSLQYREGIKTYLNVINAQSDLHTAELNYFNALFNVLSGKIDLQKALGTLPVQY
ncbi:TolC family protein [Mucilaginibacter sp. HMF5004]|uniref:TolC family protein n=1 Tax=Mucilaginibacter rivuli TaxID=2857527 RepID=UPI001C5D2E54|nr:TolC family protein [Mucilaginibacter rivuli]MBW4889262.1 TolC family protein [Mucilaginibacter rivuli]